MLVSCVVTILILHPLNYHSVTTLISLYCEWFGKLINDDDYDDIHETQTRTVPLNKI